MNNINHLTGSRIIKKIIINDGIKNNDFVISNHKDLELISDALSAKAGARDRAGSNLAKLQIPFKYTCIFEDGFQINKSGEFYFYSDRTYFDIYYSDDAGWMGGSSVTIRLDDALKLDTLTNLRKFFIINHDILRPFGDHESVDDIISEMEQP